ncbi:DUF5415 family protein [Enterococcus sp. RIT-PI-f]|uniref:DUF5415 family protein n=1 Tax=Enterococcus sp. RIT-PI-f TaxID=1690244 RepID=UPI0006B89205|nr:DUF5415 family protein [Enterococcus sp. RIT-PI-f]KPG70839.1 hypothetical protein AEQ18_06545 [Enterococcus sp. RIT-PI-f]
MAAKKSTVSPYVEAAKDLLSQEGISFKEWSNDHLRDKKMAILEGKDKEWEESTIERQCETYVLSKLHTLVSNKNQPNIGGEKHVTETTTTNSTTSTTSK